MRITTGKKSLHNLAPSNPHARRILHIIGSMNCGGIETWLLHILRAVDRSELAMDFLVHAPEPAFYDEEILDLGARIVFAGHHKAPIQLARRMSRAFEALGPYDVVHSHVGLFSGFSLALARYHKIPVRIAHSHNMLAPSEHTEPLPRKIYNSLMANQIRYHATHGLAASPEAARGLFGDKWQFDPRFQVLFCGLDFSAFEAPVDNAAIRKQFGFTPDNFVLTHIGSFSPQKNHDFLLDVMYHLSQKDPQIRLLLIGDGPLANSIRKKSAILGLTDHIHLAGLRTDIANILKAADAFVFPSISEGLGLALVEAQAAGLHCFVSDTVPKAATVLPEIVHRLSLKASAELWADTIARHHASAPIRQKDALAAVRESPFDVRYSLNHLKQVYGLRPS